MALTKRRIAQLCLLRKKCYNPRIESFENLKAGCATVKNKDFLVAVFISITNDLACHVDNSFSHLKERSSPENELYKISNGNC